MSPVLFVQQKNIVQIRAHTRPVDMKVNPRNQPMKVPLDVSNWLEHDFPAGYHLIIAPQMNQKNVPNVAGHPMIT